MVQKNRTTRPDPGRSAASFDSSSCKVSTRFAASVWPTAASSLACGGAAAVPGAGCRLGDTLRSRKIVVKSLVVQSGFMGKNWRSMWIQLDSLGME